MTPCCKNCVHAKPSDLVGWFACDVVPPFWAKIAIHNPNDVEPDDGTDCHAFEAKS